MLSFVRQDAVWSFVRQDDIHSRLHIYPCVGSFTYPGIDTT